MSPRQTGMFSPQTPSFCWPAGSMVLWRQTLKRGKIPIAFITWKDPPVLFRDTTTPGLTCSSLWGETWQLSHQHSDSLGQNGNNYLYPTETAGGKIGRVQLIAQAGLWPEHQSQCPGLWKVSWEFYYSLVTRTSVHTPRRRWAI